MILYYLSIWAMVSTIVLVGYIAIANKPGILTISDVLFFILCLPASIISIIIYIIVKFIMYLNTIVIYKKEK